MNEPAETAQATRRSIVDAYRGYSQATAASMAIIDRKDDTERPKSRVEKYMDQKKAQIKAADKYGILEKIGEKIDEKQAQKAVAKQKKAQEAQETQDKENKDESNLAASTTAALRGASIQEANLLAAAETQEEENAILEEPESEESELGLGATVSGENPELDDQSEHEQSLQKLDDKHSIQTPYGTVREKNGNLYSKSPKALMSAVAARNPETFTLNKGSAQQAIDCMREGLNFGVNCVKIDPVLEAKFQKEFDANPAKKAEFEDLKAAHLARGDVSKYNNPGSLTADSPSLQADSMVALSDPKSDHYNPRAAKTLNNEASFKNNDRRQAIEVLSEKHESGEISDAQFYAAAQPMMDKMATSDDLNDFRNKEDGKFKAAEEKYKDIKKAKTMAPTADETQAAGLSETLEANAQPGEQHAPTPLPQEPTPQRSGKPLPPQPRSATADTTEAQVQTTASTTPAPEPQKPSKPVPPTPEPENQEPPVWTNNSLKEVHLLAETPQEKGKALAQAMDKGVVRQDEIKNLKDELGPKTFTEVASVALTTVVQPSTPAPTPGNQSENKAEKESIMEAKKEQKSQNVSNLMNNMTPDELGEVVNNVSKTATSGDGSSQEKAAQASLERMDDNKDNWARAENHLNDDRDKSSTKTIQDDDSQPSATNQQSNQTSATSKQTSSKSNTSSTSAAQQSTNANSNNDEQEEQSATKGQGAKGGSQLSAGGIAGKFGAPPAVQKIVDLIAEKAQESREQKQSGKTQTQAPSTPSPGSN